MSVPDLQTDGQKNDDPNVSSKELSSELRSTQVNTALSKDATDSLRSSIGKSANANLESPKLSPSNHKGFSNNEGFGENKGLRGETNPYENKTGEYEPNRLMKLYLLGQLSKGEMLHRLRVYNSVKAETTVREDRHNPLVAADMRDFRPASMDPKGNIAPPNPQEESEQQKHKSIDERAIDNDPEKQKQEVKQQQEQIQRRHEVLIATITDEINKQVVTTHQESEAERNKEAEERPLPPASPLDYLGNDAFKKAHASLGTVSALRDKMNAHNQDKQSQGSVNSGKGASGDKSDTQDLSPTLASR